MTNKAIIYIVDDDAGIRGALSLLMRTAGHPAKVYASAQEFLEGFEPTLPGCLLLDVRMPGMSGLELQQKLKASHFDFPIIIMTGHGDIAMAVKAMKNGAYDFIEKPFDNQTLLDTVHKVLTETNAQWQLKTQQLNAMEQLARLTPREREVMELLLEGKINKQVADNLNISVRTVERHRFNCMEKLQVRNLMDIANMVMSAKGSLS